MKKLILILILCAMVACAGDSVEEAQEAQEVTCTPDRGVWPCVGPEFESQFEELAPPEDAQLWTECQDISGSRTCCVGLGDRPKRGEMACCQACDKHGCTGAFCSDVIGGWHY